MALYGDLPVHHDVYSLLQDVMAESSKNLFLLFMQRVMFSKS